MHGLEHGRAVLAAAARLGLEPVPVTAPGAAAFWGVGYLRSLERALDRPLVVDCGDDPGVALAALRAGCRTLLFTGRADVADKLASIASQLEACVARALDPPALALRPDEDPERALAALANAGPVASQARRL